MANPALDPSSTAAGGAAPKPAPTGIKRQFFWSMVPLAVLTIVNIFSVKLFVEFLGKDLYALWFYVSTFSGAFGFMDLGLGVAVGRYIGVALGAKDSAAVRRYWGTGNMVAIPLLGLMAAGFVAVGVWFGPKWFNVHPENVRMLQWAFVCGGIGLFLSYYNQFWLVLSQAHLDFKFIGILRSVLSVVQVLTSLWLAYATHNPVLLILATATTSFVQLVFFASHAARNYQLRLNLKDASMACAREISGYVANTFGTLLAGSFLGSVDRLLIGNRAVPAQFAYYTIASNFGSRIQALSQAFMGPVFHQTSRAIGRGRSDAAAHIYNETFDFTFGWYALVSVWAVCWHPVFLRLWLGSDLAPHVAAVFAPLVVAFCLSAVASISSAQLGPLNRMGTMLVFNIASGLVCAVAVLVGWNRAGLAGAAWGFLASRVVTFVQDLYVIRLVGGAGWLSIRTWRHLLAQCAVGGFFATAYLAVPRDSFWLILPAVGHGAVVAAWLSRVYIGRIRSLIGTSTNRGQSSTSP